MEDSLDCALTEALFAELAGAMEEDRCKMQNLSLGGICLSSVPPDQLAKVVAGLLNADISNAALEKKQVAALIAALIESTKLEVLDVCGLDLSQVEPKTLARMVHSIGKVYLEVSLKPQMKEIFKMCTNATTLHTLYITVPTLNNEDRELLDEASKWVTVLLEEDTSEYEEDTSEYEEEEESEDDEELVVEVAGEDDKLEVPNQVVEELQIADQEDEEVKVEDK